LNIIGHPKSFLLDSSTTSYENITNLNRIFVIGKGIFGKTGIIDKGPYKVSLDLNTS